MMRENYHEVLGWEIPKGTFPCWPIAEWDRQQSMKQKKPFSDSSPSCYFKLIRLLDNNFVEGYLGHSSFNGEFHENISQYYTYLDNYLKRQPVYFSFDRVTLYRLETVHSSKPLTFILKRIDNPKTVKENTAFMIMPFRFQELNMFYEAHIKAFLRNEMKIDILRADDFNGNDIIIETIYSQIEKAEMIIVDTSHENKNAFYEFGFAAAKEKEIITIQNKDIEQVLFFDRAHIRAIFYSLDDIAGFQKQLKNTIESIRQKAAAKN